MIKKILACLIVVIAVQAVYAQQVFIENIGTRSLITLLAPADLFQINRKSDNDFTMLALISKSGKFIHRNVDIVKIYQVRDSNQYFIYQYFCEIKPGDYDLNIKIENRESAFKLEKSFSIEIPKTQKQASHLFMTFFKDQNEYLTADQNWQAKADSVKIYFYTEKKPQKLTFVYNNIRLSLNPTNYTVFVLPDSVAKSTLKNCYIEASIDDIDYVSYFEVFSSKKVVSWKYSLEDQLLQLRIIMTQSEYEYYRRLPLNQLSEEISHYWNKKDPTPLTPENEFQEVFYKRILEADSRYSLRGYKSGWKTDFGRVFIKYGEPDEVQKENFPLGKYPVVIWTYRAQEKTFFFDDKKGYGYYELRSQSNY